MFNRTEATEPPRTNLPGTILQTNYKNASCTRRQLLLALSAVNRECSSTYRLLHVLRTGPAAENQVKNLIEQEKK